MRTSGVYQLGSVLSQNLKKGARGLTALLEEEALSSMTERKNNARKLGEKAGTKLLFPMILMLGIVMVILLAITPLCRRWLTILPLGGDTARAVGMALTPTRIALLLLAACLTATATMTIGPLSFVGLMAPHIARMMGFRRTMPHIVISALVGGLLLVFADWCGRMVLFPFQIPAGLLSTFIGAPYFIYLLRKQSR